MVRANHTRCICAGGGGGEGGCKTDVDCQDAIDNLLYGANCIDGECAICVLRFPCVLNGNSEVLLFLHIGYENGCKKYALRYLAGTVVLCYETLWLGMHT